MAELWPFIQSLVKKWQPVGIKNLPLPLDGCPPFQKSLATLEYDII